MPKPGDGQTQPAPTPATRYKGPARRQPAGPGTRLFEAELGARSVQIIPICAIGAGSDEIGEAVHNGGYLRGTSAAPLPPVTRLTIMDF
jgi:hypothetical protein